MNVLFSILPFIMIIALIILLVKISTSVRETFFQGKRNRWLFAGYLGLLLISAGVFLFLPVNKEESQEIDLSKIPDLSRISIYEEPIESASDYKEDAWEFDYDGQQLEVMFQGEGNQPMVMWETKPADESTIEVELYMTPKIMEGIDMTTDFIQPTQVDLQNDQLMVTMPEVVDVNVTAYKKEFPIRQFTDDTWMEGWEPRGAGVYVQEESGDVSDDEAKKRGGELLYLRVPEDTEVIEH